jgi:hypothetical protein
MPPSFFAVVRVAVERSGGLKPWGFAVTLVIPLFRAP